VDILVLVYKQVYQFFLSSLEAEGY